MSIFDPDESMLKHLIIDEKPVRARDISDFLQENVVKKFCSLCSHFNIDHLDPLALPVIMLLMCKSRDSLSVCSRFLQTQHEHSIFLDPKFETPDPGEEYAQRQSQSAFQHGENIFSAISDWATLLEYVESKVEGGQLEFIESNQILTRMREALKEAGITQTKISEADFVVLCVFYMAPRSTLAPKMMERLCQRVGVKGGDVELKCMRFVTRFFDAPMDEEAQNRLYIRLCKSLEVKSSFERNVQKALRAAMDVEKQNQSRNKSSLTQLRYLATHLHNSDELAYTQTFDNWRVVQKFGNTTSTHMQRMLYFIQAQVTATPEDAYAHLYTRDIVARVRAHTMERIDVNAVIDVIKSLRVYNNGIPDLLDFRTQCLAGLSIAKRKNLPLSHVAQLYVCIFQHDSIWEACWKAVVSVVNHTIISARDKFRQTHVFDIGAVVRNVIDCHVNTQKNPDSASGKPFSSPETSDEV